MDDLEMLDIRTARGFLAERGDFFRVSVVKSPVGDGWDVVLRLDGTFDTREAASQAAERMKSMLVEIRDLDHDRWISWDS